MVYQAGLVSLFRTIFVLVLLYYGIRLFFRYIYPYLFNSSKSKTNSSSFNTKDREKKKHKSDSLGEYVDYEEVEEDDTNK
jgi:hypothetical protein